VDVENKSRLILWTDKEKQVLRFLYPHLPLKIISKFLGRSLKSCESVVERLQLKKGKFSVEINKDTVLAYIFCLEPKEWKQLCQDILKIRKKRWEILSDGGFPMREKEGRRKY